MSIRVPVTFSTNENGFAEIEVEDVSHLPRSGDTLLLSGGSVGAGETIVKVDHVFLNYQFKDHYRGNVASFHWAKVVVRKA